METGSDPITMLLTTGGGGIGGGALTAYVLTRLAGKNGSSDSSNNDLKLVADKLDHTNELLNELLRSHARLEGLLQQRG
jgi:hypothetical protein